jgi:hypothetical protein
MIYFWHVLITTDSIFQRQYFITKTLKIHVHLFLAVTGCVLFIVSFSKSFGLNDFIKLASMLSVCM